MTDHGLKPCPFCPPDKSDPFPQYNAGYAYVVCNSCGTEGPYAARKGQSVTLWNTRAGEKG